MLRRSLSLFVLSLTVASGAVARPALRDVAPIDDGLMAIAIADDIRKRCDGIDARMLHALSVLHGLKSEAYRLGYSRAEVEDYVTSRSEKARMRGKAEAYLTARGVDPKNKNQICAFGAAEMKRGGPIGELLR